MKTFLYTLFVWYSLVTSAQTATFKGAWFQIQYPSNFIATGSMKSLTADGFDSAVFTSPNKQVEFYVFSPQWEGEANDIKLQGQEKLSNTKTQISGDTEITWWTITSPNGTIREATYKRHIKYFTQPVFLELCIKTLKRWIYIKKNMQILKTACSHLQIKKYNLPGEQF
ncbi:MAG: hypothetical protein EBQ77_09415 [Sphingobacteriia bacterium]|nr:hypothetical protein [Sphingobacteriia bacterium]